MQSSESDEGKAPDPAASLPSRQSGRSLLQSTSVVSGMTLLSRVLGLVCDIVLARYFGAGVVMDAFIVANRIPNMLRRFFAEGAFSQGFVPVMARYREQHKPEEARELMDAVAGTLGVLLFVVTLLGMVMAPLLVLLVAPGFLGDSGRFDIATTMTRLTFPYLFFISLTAFAGGILNTYGRFAASAFTPALLNVALIACAMWLSPHLAEPGMAMAWGVFIAGVVQLLFQIPFLAKIHAIPRPRWLPRHDGVRRIGRLMVPAVFGSSVAQVNVLLSGVIASLLGVGKISLLYYSDRLMEFPLGLFGIALATVTLPYLSRQHASASKSGFSRTVDWSMKLVMLVAVPATLGLILLSDPLVATIFYGGEFSAFDVEMTALSLEAFAFGLLGFSIVKILAPAYFAREDTKTPVKVGIIALVVNVVLSIIFAWLLTRAGHPGSHAGLALATSVAAIVNAWLLYRGLRRDDVIQHAADWPALLGRMAVANAAMSVCLVIMSRPNEWWLAASLAARSLWLAASIGTAFVVYVAMLLLCGFRLSALRLH